jgi:glycosyltransferase involved in cell wall biosynthesis
MFVTPFDYVPDAELADLYRGARATLVLSRSEGFGFPVLESMACGTPVLHSGAGSLAEVAGGAGIQVKLDDEESIAADMQRVHADAELRMQLAEKGLAQAANFTWKNAVDRLLGVFSEVGGEVAALAGAGGHGSSH